MLDQRLLPLQQPALPPAAEQPASPPAAEQPAHPPADEQPILRRNNHRQQKLTSKLRLFVHCFEENPLYYDLIHKDNEDGVKRAALLKKIMELIDEDSASTSRTVHRCVVAESTTIFDITVILHFPRLLQKQQQQCWGGAHTLRASPSTSIF